MKNPVVVVVGGPRVRGPVVGVLSSLVHQKNCSY
jgi:hypothetical protein